MWIRVCRYKNAGVAGYAEAFIPVQSDSQTSEWYSYFENDVLVSIFTFFFPTCSCIAPTSAVEYQRIPRSSRRFSVSGAGCPYRLFLPQEIRTSSGCAKSSSASPVALDAPWCPASRMVQRRGFCAEGWVDGADGSVCSCPAGWVDGTRGSACSCPAGCLLYTSDAADE